MRNRMEAGRGGGNEPGPKLATVSCSVPYAPGGSSPGGGVLDSRARACASVRLPIPLVAAVGANLGLKGRRFVDRPKRYEDVREPMERRQGRWNDRQPDVAAVSVAMPRAPTLHRFVLGRFRSRAGPCPSPRSCLPVRISVPVVATDGALFRTRIECRRALHPAGGPIHNGTRGARALPVGHRRVGQHADAHLPLLGNSVLWAYTEGRIYVRGRRAFGRLSCGAEPPT
jgi:hypothetical protein